MLANNFKLLSQDNFTNLVRLLLVTFIVFEHSYNTRMLKRGSSNGERRFYLGGLS